MSHFTLTALRPRAAAKSVGTFLAAGLACFIFLAIALFASTEIVASEVQSNLVLMPVQSFTGMTDSVPIPPDLVGGMTGVETGPITLSLDPSATNVFGLDNVLQQGKIDVTLVLSSALFTYLGETPKIHIVETGPASVQYPENNAAQPASESHCAPNFDFYFHADLTGGGTVENGLFAGTVFHNVNAYDGEGVNGSWIVLPFSTVTWNIQDHGSVTFTDQTTVTGLGGSGSLFVVPEPSGMILGGLGLAAIVVLPRRFKRR